MLSVTAHSHSTNGYRRSCSSSAERVGLVDAALARAENYTTQKSLRSCYQTATSWLPPLWECFAFKQTRSCWRWRRVCRGVKRNCSTQWKRSKPVSFPPGISYSYIHKLLTQTRAFFNAARQSGIQFVFAPLPSRVCGFLSYRDTMSHLITVLFLLRNVSRYRVFSENYK